jgi:uncharacterized membrane protein
MKLIGGWIGGGWSFIWDNLIYIVIFVFLFQIFSYINKKKNKAGDSNNKGDRQV